jgi:hypothetical protein
MHSKTQMRNLFFFNLEKKYKKLIFHFEKKNCDQCLYVVLHKTIHILAYFNKSIAMVSPKNLYPGGIWTSGGCDKNCATHQFVANLVSILWLSTYICMYVLVLKNNRAKLTEKVWTGPCLQHFAIPGCLSWSKIRTNCFSFLSALHLKKKII